MHITVPPVLIPLFLAFLVFCVYRWLVGLAGPKRRAREAFLELVAVPLTSFLAFLLILHVSGSAGEHIDASILHGLSWGVQGLVWDVMHPFAYGFGIRF